MTGLGATLVAAVLDSELPGPGCVYLSQTLKFLRPVKLGDTITAREEVVETVRDRNRARLRTECANGAGELVLAGEAWVMPPAAAQQRSAAARRRRRSPAPPNPEGLRRS